MNKLFNLLLCSFIISSCGDDNFPEQSKLDGLRVLAISADKPEINSATSISLTPLISYVNGEGRVVNFTWEACPDPGIDFGALVNCNTSPAALKQTGNGTFNTNTLAGSHFTGNIPVINLNIGAPIFAYFSTLSSDLQFNGIDYLFILTFTDPTTGESLTGLKKIKLTSKASGDLNTNPNFTGILNNNSALTSYPTSEANLTLSNPSSAQTYASITNVGTKTFTEDMFISWYSSTGEFLFNRTDIGEVNKFTPSGATGVFVAVYRDSRGGIASQIISF